LDVALAVNGREAVERVRREAFDAVLMDVQMPVMDGYAATDEIRKWEGGRRKRGGPPLPIIAMTANAMSGDSVKSIAAGMNAHITKPIDPGLLFETLVQWIPPKRQRRRASTVHASLAGRSRAGTADELVLPEELSGFNLAEGLSRLQGNRALYRRLLQNFADQHRHERDTLRRALDHGDFDQMRQRVHAIKGVAGNLAAKPLQAAAAVLERRIQSVHSGGTTDTETLATALEDFTDALDLTMNDDDSLILSGGDRREPCALDVPPPQAPEIAGDIIAGLRAAAELGDVSELTALARVISERPGELFATGDRIRMMAEEFDFEGILELVAELEALR